MTALVGLALIVALDVSAVNPDFGPLHYFAVRPLHHPFDAGDLRKRREGKQRHPGGRKSQVADLHRTSRCKLLGRKFQYTLYGSSNKPICSLTPGLVLRRLSGLPTTPSTSTARSASRGAKMRCWLLEESG